MERRTVRCAIYTRQSVARPNDTDFSSCEAQREACLELIGAHAPEAWVSINERFDDIGESGATIERLRSLGFSIGSTRARSTGSSCIASTG